ncbi:hypothetical protein OQA88_2453 [Cercophora sp. LCS_1]
MATPPPESSTNTRPFEYEPLVEDDEIRLLHLQPGTGEGDVHFSLHTVNLNDYPSYEALSYCWGDINDTRLAYCEGMSLQITNSLFTALKHLRQSGEARVIWADAVCINQYDIPEKSAQVQLMSRIYSQPTRVLIWLGNDMDDLDGLDECLKGAREVLPPEDNIDFEFLCEKSRTLFRDTFKLREEGKPTFIDHDWTPFNNLLCRPWFDRRWVIQEMALSDESVPRVGMCGDLEFSWDELGGIASRLGSYCILPLIAGLSMLECDAPHKESFYVQEARPLYMLTAVYMSYLLRKLRDKADLVDVVMATPLYKCLDPRDHLFALLSLSSRGTSLTADYSLSVEDAYIKFATTTLVEEQNLRILSLAPHTTQWRVNQELPRLDLPSWVPDLTCAGTVNPMISYNLRAQMFHAGGSEKPPVAVSDDGGRLYLQARIVDKVGAMTLANVDMEVPSDEDILPRVGSSYRIKMWKRNWFRACREVAAGGNWGGATEEFRKTFYETLCCGMILARDPLPEDVAAAVPTYVEYVMNFFTPGYEPTEETKDTLLTYGAMIESSLHGMAEGRRFCRTEAGRLGQVPAATQDGDVFAVISGAEVPYILRPCPERPGVYTLVGDCYLHGLMQGEALADGLFEPVDITLE